MFSSRLTVSRCATALRPITSCTRLRLVSPAFKTRSRVPMFASHTTSGGVHTHAKRDMSGCPFGFGAAAAAASKTPASPQQVDMRTTTPVQSNKARKSVHTATTPPSNALGLSQSTIDTCKATAPVLAEHGYAITRAMYRKMFAENPSVQESFNMTHQVELDGEPANQPASLAAAVHAYAQYLDRPEVLGEAIERIAQKHVSLNVRAPEYDVVGTYLLGAITEVLGDAATPAIMDAWTEAYGALAGVFIARETELREAQQLAEGGWAGWRDFTVFNRVEESSNITSFYLEPTDGKGLVTHKPGQYIAIRAEVPGHVPTTRNYTLSNQPGESFYRLTVKREDGVDGAPAGLVSTWLHNDIAKGSELKIGVPCGEFVLNETAENPVVMISGGVGLTPMVSMLEHLVRNMKHKHHITYLSAVKGADVEPMHDYLSATRRRNLNLKVKFVYDEEPNNDYPTGPLTIEHVKQTVPHDPAQADYYVCGPPAMMNNVLQGLREWGVPEEKLHHEYFGPTR